MYKFHSTGLKVLKMLHLLMIVFFLGGMLCSFALILKLNLSNYEQMYQTYKSFNTISDHIVKIGARGTILLGAIYGFSPDGDSSNTSGSPSNGFCLSYKLL